MGKHIVVFKGDRVRKGQQLTEGPVVPQEILGQVWSSTRSGLVRPGGELGFRWPVPGLARPVAQKSHPGRFR